LKSDDKILILNAIKEFYNFRFDKDFAKFLGIGQTALSSWYSRNAINWEIIFTKCVDINFDELIRNGKAVGVSNGPIVVAESAGEYEVTKEKEQCGLCVKKDNLISKLENQLDRQEREIERLSNFPPKSEPNGKRNSA